MKTKGRNNLRLNFYFITITLLLIILPMVGYSMAEDKPPTHPPQVENLRNNQIYNEATAYPSPPPPVEAPKPIFGGPVNDKLPDPSTVPSDKTIRGMKKINTAISSPAPSTKEEVIQIDTTKREGVSSQDALPMVTISVSPKVSGGIKKETVKISLPKPKFGKGQLKIVKKPLPEHSLKKKQKTDIPSRTISKQPAK